LWEGGKQISNLQEVVEEMAPYIEGRKVEGGGGERSTYPHHKSINQLPYGTVLFPPRVFSFSFLFVCWVFFFEGLGPPFLIVAVGSLFTTAAAATTTMVLLLLMLLLLLLPLLLLLLLLILLLLLQREVFIVSGGSE